VRPWRRATLVASLIAGVELVLLLVCGAVLIAKPLAHAVKNHAAKVAASTPAQTTTPVVHTPVVHRAAAPPKATHSRSQTKVLVLNGNGRTGEAHAEAARLQSLGYHIAGAADASRSDYATTVVMYRPGYRPEAVRLAHDMHAGVVGPLDGIQQSALHGGQLAVILGA
jgi:hypothetical protein